MGKHPFGMVSWRVLISVLDMNVEELTGALAAAGGQAYRAQQVADWVYGKGVVDPALMTNLPPALRGQLEVLTSGEARRSQSTDGTIKLLVEFRDGQQVETVLIPSERFATACLSTQAGCAIGCAFCASGLGGLGRSLTSSEMLQQMLHLWQASGRRPTHVVFMGMGEPLANYDATVGALRAIVDPKRWGISARRVTVSTVGLPVGIRRLAGEGLPITLAVSLHAPNDALRRELIPAARKTTIEEILRAAEEFQQSRNREVTLEYVLLEGVNDSALCAEGVAKLAHRLRCSVNLIRYNPVAGLSYRPPAEAAVRDFAQRLRKRGVNALIRTSRGEDAEAACGQLRRAP
jgi:23S rRNA (adenine2503-C2)-methyltransferase